MDFLPVLLIGLGLSADCFAVALGCGVSIPGLSRVQIVRTSFSFGAFQFGMPVLGWLGGRTLVDIVSQFDHWVSFGLLALVGGRMIWEAFHGEKEGADITRGLPLLGLSLATSIDALAVGLGLAFVESGIFRAGITFGIVTFAVTAAGFLLSRRLGSLFGKRARIGGGVVLTAIGLRILLTSLLGE